MLLLTALLALRAPQPTIVCASDWILFQHSNGRWSRPGPKLDKAKVTADVFVGGKKTGSVSGVVKMTTDESTQYEAPTLVVPNPLPENSLCVSGGKAKMMVLKPLDKARALAEVKMFVKQEMLKPRKIELDEAVQGDFNGDGKVAWLVWSQDSWGTSVSMVTLSKAGKPTVVETTGFGD
jgi:hypothetical protein